MSQPNTQVAVIPREQTQNQIQVISGDLNSPRVRNTIGALIRGTSLSVDRVIKVALAAVVRNEDLLKCSGSSILRAVCRGCEVGLEPGGLLGQAYLVPMRHWKDGVTTYDCELWLGYQGCIELVRRACAVSTIWAEVWKPGDEFSCRYGLNPDLVHVPSWDDRDPAIESLGAYSVATMKDGAKQFVTMSRAQVEAVRLKSSGGTYQKDDNYGHKKGDPRGAWLTDWDEQAKKTSIKRIYKVLPKAVIDQEMAERIHALMSRDEDTPPSVIDAPSTSLNVRVPYPEEEENEPPNAPPPVAINVPAPAADPPRRGRPPKEKEVNPAVVPPVPQTQVAPPPAAESVPYGAELDAISQPPPAAARPAVSAPPPAARAKGPSTSEQEEFNSMFPPDEGERL